MTSIAWVLVSAEALGCSCLEGLDEVRPPDGAVGVATDAAPFLLYSEAPGPVTLLDAETGEEVPITVEQTTHGEAVVVRLVPNAPLEPQHGYVIDGGSDYGFVAFPVTFTTGDGPDADPPGPVALREVDEAGSPSTGKDCGGTLFLIPKLGDAPEDAVYEAQLAWTEGFSDAATASAADRHRVLLGQTGCGAATVPELERGDEVWVRARAVDLSGNEGPWSDVVHVRSVGGGPLGAGCAAVPGGSVWPGVVGFAAIGLGVTGRGRGR
jgi:hypothetical protein